MVGVLVAVVVALASFPPAQAIPLSFLIAAAAYAIVRWDPAKPHQWARDPNFIAAAAVGVVAASVLVVSVGKSGDSDEVPLGGPTITPTGKGEFTGTIRAGGTQIRTQPHLDAASGGRYEAGSEILFAGFCLGLPTAETPPYDFRWYMVSGAATVVPSTDVEGAPPPGALPQRCEGGSSPPTQMTLSVGYDWEFLDGIKDPLRPNLTYPFVLAAVGSHFQQVGFAAEANDPDSSGAEEWISLGMTSKMVGFYAFVLYLPDGLHRVGIDPGRPVRVLASVCYGPRAPGLNATMGLLEASGSEPFLINERKLALGAASDARAAACDPVVSSVVA